MSLNSCSVLFIVVMSTRRKICAMHMASSEIVTVKAVLNILLIKFCYFNAHLFYSSVNGEMLRFPPFHVHLLSLFFFFFLLIIAGGLCETLHVLSSSDVYCWGPRWHSG